jgi:hypothetical protein
VNASKGYDCRTKRTLFPPVNRQSYEREIEFEFSLATPVFNDSVHQIKAMPENPFTRRDITPAPPMRVLHRFTKPGGHWAEIRERKATQFDAIEFLVFVDGSLLVSQMFDDEHKAEYPHEVEARIKQFTTQGWIEERRIEERRSEERRGAPRVS